MAEWPSILGLRGTHGVERAVNGVRGPQMGASVLVNGLGLRGSPCSSLGRRVLTCVMRGELDDFQDPLALKDSLYFWASLPITPTMG